jgi:outer membrane protein assembly factor BamB
MSAASINRNVFYLGTKGYATAINQDSGEELWRTSLPSSGWDSVTVLREERFLIFASHGHVYRLDPLDGKIVWHNELSGLGLGPITLLSNLDVPNISKPLLYLGIIGFVVALRLDDGQEIFRVELPESGGNMVSMIMTKQGNIIANCYGRFFQVDGGRGTVMWNSEIPGFGNKFMSMTSSKAFEVASPQQAGGQGFQQQGGQQQFQAGFLPSQQPSYMHGAQQGQPTGFVAQGPQTSYGTISPPPMQANAQQGGQMYYASQAVQPSYVATQEQLSANTGISGLPQQQQPSYMATQEQLSAQQFGSKEPHVLAQQQPSYMATAEQQSAGSTAYMGQGQSSGMAAGQPSVVAGAEQFQNFASLHRGEFNEDNWIFVGATGNVAVIDADRQGAEIWRLKLPVDHGVTSLRFDHGLLLVAVGHHVFALNPKTGQIQWENIIAEIRSSHGCITTNRPICSRACRSQELQGEPKLFVGTYGHVVCLREATGGEIWRKELPSAGHNVVSLMFENHRIYAGTNGKLYALNSETGDIMWQNDLSGLGYQVICFATDNISMNHAFDAIPQVSQEQEKHLERRLV